MEPALPPYQDEVPVGHPPISLRPPRGTTPAPAALPAAPTPLLGRDAEVGRVRAILWEAETRLLTLTGPGGVGKTRLALAAAGALVGHYADGVRFADLSPVRDPALVPGAVAAALGVKESPDRPIAEALAAYLRDKDLLLVLDNCEQVADAASQFASWLAHSPALVLLATSRAPLRLRWERTLPVEPLALPGADASGAAQLARSPAVALFVARARAVRPDFALTAENAPAVAELCRRLDGLPLAIELVAIQVRMLSPQAIVARLAERRELPAAPWHDLPERHRTLAEAIAWSHDLLAPAERALFRRLGVFAGGWTLAAAEAIGGGNEAVPDPVAALLALADQSLVRQAEGMGEPRFAMLETVREFAAEQLAGSGEAAAIGQRHADFFLALAEEADAAFIVEGEVHWIARLEADVENIRAALRWYADHGQASAGLRLASALSFFWRANGRLREGYAWLAGPFAAQLDSREPVLSARVERSAGFFSYLLGEYGEAKRHSRAAVAHASAAGDAAELGQAHSALGLAQRMLGEHERARESFHAGLALLRAAPVHASLAADILNNLGGVDFDQGEYASSAAYYTEAIALYRQAGKHNSLANALTNLAVARVMQGDFRVRDLLDESLTLSQSLRVHATLALTLAVLALLAATEGQFARTARLLGAAEAVRAVEGLPIPAAERPHHERVAAAARAALGDDRFAACWAIGGGWNLDEMIAYARQRTESLVPPTVATAPAPAPVALTRRERDVLEQLVAGRTNREIADLLSIGERTVETHVAHLVAKLGVANRVQAASQAIAWGLT